MPRYSETTYPGRNEHLLYLLAQPMAYFDPVEVLVSHLRSVVLPGVLCERARTVYLGVVGLTFGIYHQPS